MGGKACGDDREEGGGRVTASRDACRVGPLVAVLEPMGSDRIGGSVIDSNDDWKRWLAVPGSESEWRGGKRFGRVGGGWMGPDTDLLRFIWACGEVYIIGN